MPQSLDEQIAIVVGDIGAGAIAGRAITGRADAGVVRDRRSVGRMRRHRQGSQHNDSANINDKSPLDTHVMSSLYDIGRKAACSRYLWTRDQVSCDSWGLNGPMWKALVRTRWSASFTHSSISS